METHGTYHLADNAKQFEVQRSNNFEFIVSFDKAMKRAGYNSEVAETIDARQAQEVMRLSVVSASVPSFSQEVITIKRGNSVIKSAGVPSFSSGSLKVNDFIGADDKSVLYAWQRLSYDVSSDTVGSMADYKKDCTLIEYTPDYKQVRYWELKGCWISELSEDAFDMNNGDKREISATIQYDRAIPHMPDEE